MLCISAYIQSRSWRVFRGWAVPSAAVMAGCRRIFFSKGGQIHGCKKVDDHSRRERLCHMAQWPVQACVQFIGGWSCVKSTLISALCLASGWLRGYSTNVSSLVGGTRRRQQCHLALSPLRWNASSDLCWDALARSKTQLLQQRQ